MSNRTEAPVWDPAAVYGPDWERLHVVTESDGRCHYVAEWSPRGDRGVVRKYRRTAAEHSWDREVTVCTRCGLRWDDAN